MAPGPAREGAHPAPLAPEGRRVGRGAAGRAQHAEKGPERVFFPGGGLGCPSAKRLRDCSVAFQNGGVPAVKPQRVGVGAGASLGWAWVGQGWCPRWWSGPQAVPLEEVWPHGE